MSRSSGEMSRSSMASVSVISCGQAGRKASAFFSADNALAPCVRRIGFAADEIGSLQGLQHFGCGGRPQAEFLLDVALYKRALLIFY